MKNLVTQCTEIKTLSRKNTYGRVDDTALPVFLDKFSVVFLELLDKIDFFKRFEALNLCQILILDCETGLISGFGTELGAIKNLETKIISFGSIEYMYSIILRVFLDHSLRLFKGSRSAKFSYI